MQNVNKPITGNVRVANQVKDSLMKGDKSNTGKLTKRRPTTVSRVCSSSHTPPPSPRLTCNSRKQQPSGSAMRAARSLKADQIPRDLNRVCTEEEKSAGYSTHLCKNQVTKHEETCESLHGKSSVELTFCEVRPADPKGFPVVLVHGLNGSCRTWKDMADELGSHKIRNIAFDLRGHGHSPLGEPEDFGPRQLAADVRNAMRRMGLLKNGSKVVLVGHSMGGRIAMRYAAEFPEDLVALVVEDIDCVPVDISQESPAEAKELEQIWRCSQNEKCKKVQKSVIRLMAQYLAFKTVLCADDALQAFHQIAAARTNHHSFSVHAFIAGRGSVCDWDERPGGVHDMEEILPCLQIKEFPQAGHFIHRSPAAQTDFVNEIVAIACGSQEISHTSDTPVQK